jgi:parallel beta-helix repeat protein
VETSEQRLAALEARMARLESGPIDDVAAAPAPGRPRPDVGSAPLSRRGLLRTGWMAAAGAGGLLVAGRPAGATAAVPAAPVAPAARAQVGPPLAMGSVVNVRAPDPLTNTPAAVGDGVTDDTAAIQARINLLAFYGGGTLFLPFGKYRVSATLTMNTRVHLVGEGGFQHLSQANLSSRPTFISAAHTGTVINIPTGVDFCAVRNIAFIGSEGTGDASTLHLQGARALVDGCHVFRGGRAAVRIRGGTNVFTNNWIQASQAAPWAADRSHGLWLEACSDSIVAMNQIAAHGAAVLMSVCGGVNVENNFVFNSYQGIVMQGCRQCQIVGNRVDEHCREGVVVDWNSFQNQIVGNSIHTNGARVDGSVPVLERAGLRLRSGWANTISGNTFGNWCHDVTQEDGALDFCRPQQYGLVVLQAASIGPNNVVPHHNIVTGNAFDDQRVASIVNLGDPSNVIRTNVGPDFAN